MSLPPKAVCDQKFYQNVAQCLDKEAKNAKGLHSKA
jgi:hypothetical protein